MISLLKKNIYILASSAQSNLKSSKEETIKTTEHKQIQ